MSKHTHPHDKQVMNRFSRISGHVTAIKNMIVLSSSLRGAGDTKSYSMD